MGNYLLCRHKIADIPFYIENVHLNVYSVEELCYFLSNNLALADEVTDAPALDVWLKKECNLKVKDLYDLFVKSHYFTEGELRKLKIKMDALNLMTEVERQKKKGDTLIRFGKYKRCIELYENTLKMPEIKELPSYFTASIYNNMGCAYARLFQTTKALECFKKAHITDPSTVFFRAYMKAIYFDGGIEALEDFERKMEIPPDRCDEISREIESVKINKIPNDIDDSLDEWIKEYHSSVDQ